MERLERRSLRGRNHALGCLFPLTWTAVVAALWPGMWRAESADFVEAMESDSTGRDTRRAAFEAAAAKHIAVAKAAQQGMGVDRHLLALRAEGAAGGTPGSAFFEDGMMAESSHWRLSTSNLSVPCLSLFG